MPKNAPDQREGQNSQQAQEKRRRRKLYALIAVLCSLVVGLVAAFFAHTAGHQTLYASVVVGAGALMITLPVIILVLTFIEP
ncbi:hypothetical protein [Streptomyces capitiformicae]|uniref:Uncharacterized protein n=1 Tax=Streptomyces capitiformicae TaxID=2014920 RepID=A0A918Z0T1_9ACTN|nr:hypothetical protein [Streptomyces capitiformicae]GHE32068.1 hypothetical protein GCM10017771_48660 [Streptomyces capitiformicae]